MPARIAELSSRAVLHVTGDDAAAFLDRIVTADIESIGRGAAGYGALLTPQGKILTDFLILGTENGFLFDVPSAAVADLLKRLTLYRLRAKVALDDVSEDLAVVAAWDTHAPPSWAGHIARDPRHPRLGYRAIVPRAARESTYGVPETDYERHRAGLGIPAIGTDFAFGDAFPHEIGMDALSGVAFDKGCYVGQEVVSRMEHRATARRRPTIVTADSSLPPSGTLVMADGRSAGALGSAFGAHGLAILRLDRVRDAVLAGAAVTAGGVPVVVSLPDWATWTWPSDGEA